MSTAMIRLGNRAIGSGHPCLIVAELSCNHAGRLDYALDLVREAAKAGADAIKLQTFVPERMAPADRTLTDGPWAGRNLVELYREAETPWGWHRVLFEEAEAHGLLGFSSATDIPSADFLAVLNVPAIKVASFELTDLVLLRHLSKLGRPVLLSTGMASDPEIRAALDALHPVPVALLHCVSAYPTPLEAANLPRIARLRENFSRPVGLSWHHRSPVGPIVAAGALGLPLLEVHLRLPHVEGLDAPFSYYPDEFRQLVDLIRQTEALGVETGHEDTSRVLRRSPGGLRGAA